MSSANPKTVKFDQAVTLLRGGKICAFPTDTVYGLGARIDVSKAVLSLYEIKQRCRSQPLIALCANMDMANALVEFSPTASALAQFWPGALTLVLRKKSDAKIASATIGGLDSLGVRIPASPQVLKLIKMVGQPLATTSANVSGQPPALNAQQVFHQFADSAPVFEGVQNPSGDVSTILEVHENEVTLLRAGAVTTKEIETMLNITIGKQV